MLDVKLEDGSIESFPYSWLKRVRYLPGNRLILRLDKDETTNRRPQSGAFARNRH
jgi:hypothetical protein